MSTDTPKIQYPNEVEVRVKSFGETRCMNPTETENKNKNEANQKWYKEIYRMDLPGLAEGIQEKHFG